MLMKISKYLKSAGPSKVFFFFLGISSFIWFLIRVIPKPSRASYPCMRATAPFMSAFILYMISLTTTVWFLKKHNIKFMQTKFMMFFVFMVVLLFSFTDSGKSTLTLVDPGYYKANVPIGIANGIYPGRVVWIHDPKATSKTFKNVAGDYWSMDKNCDQLVVEKMLNTTLLEISGKTDATAAWDAIFRYFNSNHGKGDVGYQEGEAIAIKINLTGSYNGDMPSERMDTSPQLVFALLKQLIEVVKIPQSKIWIGDSYRTFRGEYWNKCHSVYPDVHYVDGTGLNGREMTSPSSEQLLKFSDKKKTSSIPQHYVEASYLINVPCLKSHEAGGITIAAKNHQGSIIAKGTQPEDQFADFMHYSLAGFNSVGGSYRHLVDFMGHKDLGGKTLIYIVDGIWAGRESSGWIDKWNIAPFNGDYPSSLFVSQDAVAIESVCFDFLLAEYLSKPASIKYPYLKSTDDYLLQAADPAKWPAGIKYDPEGDGTFLGSLGVYEHWNNSADKKYSRNLGTGEGIELKTPETSTSSPLLIADVDYKLYPNPFGESIHLKLKNKLTGALIIIHNSKGEIIFKKTYTTNLVWNGTYTNGAQVITGVYFVSVFDKTTGKLILNERIICKR